MMQDQLRRRIREYYDDTLRLHGRTAAGVDWNSQESQELRFRQFERLWENDTNATIVDYGCGYGGLASYLRARGHHGAYAGFDLSEAMIDAAREHTASLPVCRFTSHRAELVAADYAVASGILNVKQDASEHAWQAFAEETIADLASVGLRGFAFNALTTYSDPEKRRAHLYYADPLRWFDDCKRNYSRFVALVHDYPLWEFTILVRRNNV